jgi:exodeoxyribonuclease V gamma subunit
MESRIPAGADGLALEFADTLSGWRRDSRGEWCRIHLVASALVEDSRYRLAPLLRPWVEHVCAQAHGRALTTLVIGPKGRVEIPSRPTPEIAPSWQALWASWWSARTDGLCRALPVEKHTAGLWLRSGASDPLDDAGRASLSRSYDARCQEDLYLRRCYPDFEALLAGGFFQWVRVLYGDLNAALPESGAARKKEGG